MGAEGNRGLTEIQHNNQRALELAMKCLVEAEERYHEQTVPHTPLGEPRVFKVARFYWPTIGHAPGSLMTGVLADLPWPTGHGVNSPRLRSYLAAINEILAWTGNQPRRVWRVIRQINAVIAWCEKRAAGRKRAAEEILRQQAPWINKIASEVLVEELASGPVQNPPSGSGWIKVQLSDGRTMAAPYFGSVDNDEEE